MSGTAQGVAPEIIAIASGKGGTGKTLLGACLGYALVRAGHRVLFVDADPGTDGLSLLLLGPKGIQAVDTFQPRNTFRGVLSEARRTGVVQPEARRIDRTGRDDHGAAYSALISGKGLYGEVAIDDDTQVVPDLSRAEFRKVIVQLFQGLRSAAEYDFVIVDTRGGFAFESTDVCAAADSFILVTDPDYTSFHQDRNLVAHISAAAKSMQTKTLLRAVLVNRAVDGDERSFRLELEKEFPIRFTDTFAIPLDLEALRAYRVQQMPYVRAPGSVFASATLSAFSDILKIVTAQWPGERVQAWNALAQEVTDAVEAKNRALQAEEERAKASLLTVQRYRAFLIASMVLCVLLALTLIFSTTLNAHPAQPVASVSRVESASVLPAAPPDVGVSLVAPGVPPDAVEHSPSTPLPASSASPVSTAPPRLPTSRPLRPGLIDSTGVAAVNILPFVVPRSSYQALPGQRAANGKDLFRYTVWLAIEPRFVDQVVSVRYTFNHASFGINGYVSSQPPSFASSHDGWGCVDSVTATINLLNGPPQVLNFDQCEALSRTRAVQAF